MNPGLTTHDIDLIERDTALRRLHSLLDPHRYKALIRSTAPQFDISGAKLTYIRYKPFTNCVAGYEFMADGRIHYAYAKTFSDDQHEKQSKAGAHEGIALQFFPDDSKLRSLKKIDGGEREEKFIQRVFSDRDDLWGGRIVPIRYKPERRFVSRLVLKEQSVAVIKMHTGSSYSRLRNGNKSFKSRDNLVVARRIGHSDRHRVLAFAWLPGELLSDSLRDGSLEPAALLSVGRALSHIHAHNSNRLPVNEPNSIAEHIDAVAQQVAFLCPELARHVSKTARQIGAMLLDQPHYFCATHGDFYAKQILIDRDRVGVLDFDESAAADPMSDIGNFFAHLERDRLRFELEDQIDECQEALLTGYSAAGQPIDRQRIALFHAANLFKLLPHPFRFRENDWPQQTAFMLDRVQLLLNNVDASNIESAWPSELASTENNPLHFTLEDNALPFLRDALDCEVSYPFLSKALREFEPGVSFPSVSEARLRRHKLGRRCLIEYTLHGHTADETVAKRSIIGKARSKKLDKSTFDLTLQLWRGPFNETADDGLYVPEPIGVVPEFNMWLQRKIEGYTVTRFLLEPAAPTICRMVARMLHKLSKHGPTPKRTHTISDELDVLDRRLPDAAASHPRWAERIFQVLSACHELAESVPPPTPAPLHRDFYPDNVLVTDTGLYLLDLDLYCLGDPALDAGNFIGHIIEYSLRTQGRPDALDECTRAFEDAFVELAGSQLQPSVSIYTTLTLARHIHISTQILDRRATTGALLALCERRLAEVHAKNLV